ncbi:hypothetical protein PR003_g30987 [Phytophthora rubi]|uniref:Myb/SANT-like DNA-binding domain-containing protein n=1 Tax=Phytophthora rubi TaxID=129364 RepID=A0A6A4B962_9STRA|nr:hypothetical protein PR003_g30987 [Phytophthora rubi]
MVNKRWAAEEVHLLLNYLSNHVRDYTTGVKERFYEGARDFLSSHEHVKTKKQCKTKCGELESGYKQYKQKLAQSGFGLQVSDPPSIKEMLQKKCPFYYEIDEIFGQRHNTNPPVVMEPGRVLLEGHEDGINSNTNVADGNEDDNSRVTGGVIVNSSNLHDALLRIHQEKLERREKRYKRESELQEEQLQLQKAQLELQREEIRLREKKMDHQFALLSKTLELEQARFMRWREE